MNLVTAVLIAYLIGSISFAVLVSRAFGLPDPRSYGSGNPGATNVLRTGRKAAAVLTLLGDMAKGWFAVTLTQQHVIAEPAAAGAAALAVVVGHMWPVFFRISSLAALVAFAFAPCFSFLLHGMHRFALESAVAVTAISLLLVWRHRGNIRNLIAGTEGRIGGGSGSP